MLHLTHFIFFNFFETEFKNIFGKQYYKKDKFLEASLCIANKIQPLPTKKNKKRIFNY